MRITITTIALVASIATAQAQGYGPDGRAYYRRVPDAATYAPQPTIPQQPYAAPQTGAAPTKPKSKPDTPKPAKAPEPTVAAPVTTPPTEQKEIKDNNTLADWCKQEANARAPLCRNVGSSKVQR